MTAQAKAYRDFRPSSCDSHIRLDDREDWIVVPCPRNRDSECLDESNFHVALRRLGGEGEDVEVHRFGHWACGWFEIVLVRPDTWQARAVTEIREALDNYPILDENDHSEREMKAADETWRNCYDAKERIAYIRRYRSQFEFRSFADMLGCVRGRYFAGYASELLAR